MHLNRIKSSVEFKLVKSASLINSKDTPVKVLVSELVTQLLSNIPDLYIALELCYGASCI